MEQLITQKSMIGRALSYIGLTAIIIGVIAFAFTYSSSSSYSSNTALAITYLASGLVSGFVFFGFSEIIRLLNSISRSLGNEEDKEDSGRQLPRL